MSRAIDNDCCPVCSARFRGTKICSRCGADLAPLMHLAAEAYRLRRAARYAVHGGDFSGAYFLSRRAEELCSTEAGRELHSLTALLAGTEERLP